MDDALAENPDDEDLLQAVDNCKEIQRSLHEDYKNRPKSAPSIEVLNSFESRAKASSQLHPSDCQPNSQHRRNSWTCLVDEIADPTSTSDVNMTDVKQFESYYNSPFVDNGNRDAVDYYADLGFDLSYLQYH